MSRRPSPAEWQEICQNYQARDCTQSEFCKKLDINPNSLGYYLGKFKPKPSFSPARIEADCKQSSEIELQLPHGIKLIVRSSS